MDSLVRPGGNTTGVSILATELDGKRQELLIEAVPGLRRMAALADSNVTTVAKLNEMHVCRFHGAGGGAPKGRANGSYKHGLYTQQAKAARRLISDLLRQCRKTIAVAGGNTRDS